MHGWIPVSTPPDSVRTVLGLPVSGFRYPVHYCAGLDEEDPATWYTSDGERHNVTDHLRFWQDLPALPEGFVPEDIGIIVELSRDVSDEKENGSKEPNIQNIPKT